MNLRVCGGGGGCAGRKGWKLGWETSFCPPTRFATGAPGEPAHWESQVQTRGPSLLCRTEFLESPAVVCSPGDQETLDLPGPPLPLSFKGSAQTPSPPPTRGSAGGAKEAGARVISQQKVPRS